MMDAPAQAELVLDAPERCRRCGRLWPGLLFGAFVDLEALMKRAPDERGEFAHCWTGTCGGPK